MTLPPPVPPKGGEYMALSFYSTIVPVVIVIVIVTFSPAHNFS